MTEIETEKNFDEQLCHFEKLSDDDFCFILSFIETEDQFLYLETVSKRWASIMPYAEWRDINLAKIHRKYCRLGRICQFETGKRYPLLYRGYLHSWLWKALNSLIARCAHNVRSLDISGLLVNDDIVDLLENFPKLEELNITKCTFTPCAEKWLSELKLKSLIMHGNEVDKDILRYIDVRSLKISDNFNPESFNSLHKLVSLSLTHSSITFSNLYQIFQTCCKLESFSVNHNATITDNCAETMRTPIARHLKYLSVAMKSSTFYKIVDFFENLTELSLNIPKTDRDVVHFLPFLALNKLEMLSLQCRKVCETDLIPYVLQSSRLKCLELKAKKICCIFDCTDIKPSTTLALQNLKLSLFCIKRSARIASIIVRFSPDLRVLKLMKSQIKAPFCSEYAICENCFEFDEYNRRISALVSLQSVTIPFITTDTCTMLIENLKEKSLKKLAFYGGYLNMERMCVVEHLQFAKTLVSLKCGPYINVTGLDKFLCQLVNLQKLSFHMHMASWLVLGAIGEHAKLNKVDLRSCSDYFFKNVYYELSTLLRSRRQLKIARNRVLFKPLQLNAWSPYRHLSLPSNVEQLLDDLLIWFKFCFHTS